MRLRKQLNDIADLPLRGITEEIRGVAQLLADNYDDLRLREGFVDLALQLIIEQPLKTPFVAAVVLVLNTLSYKAQVPPTAQNGTEDTAMQDGVEAPEQTKPAEPTTAVVDDLLTKATAHLEEKVKAGDWREVKSYLKLLACLQNCLDGEGVFPILDTLFDRAVELQTASSEDVSCSPIKRRVYCDMLTDFFFCIADDWHGASQDHPTHYTLCYCCCPGQI